MRFQKPLFAMFGGRPIYSFAVGRSSSTGLMLMTAETCDAAGYENPKPLFVEKGNVYPQPMRRR